MNKIKVVDDNLKSTNIDKNILIEYYEKECLFAISEIKIIITKSTDLELEINLKEDTKLNFNIKVLEDVHLNLNILTSGVNGKVKYSYDLDKNANVDIFKFQDVDRIKEMVTINLNGDFAKVNYNFKTISNDKETYTYNIFHNSKNTVSNIKNNGVCIEDGLIIYQVSSFVPKGVINCSVVQNNRIINLTDNKCEIMPNLYIDTSLVEATHSALIGKFTDEEMFYLMSRGIDYKESLKLLITGFLTSDISFKKTLNRINKSIEKYWR